MSRIGPARIADSLCGLRALRAPLVACMLAMSAAGSPAAEPPRPDERGSGRYPALKEELASLPDHVVYRPADLDALGTQKLGVVAWGNGDALTTAPARAST